MKGGEKRKGMKNRNTGRKNKEMEERTTEMGLLEMVRKKGILYKKWE